MFHLQGYGHGECWHIRCGCLSWGRCIWSGLSLLFCQQWNSCQWAGLQYKRSFRRGGVWAEPRHSRHQHKHHQWWYSRSRWRVLCTVEFTSGWSHTGEYNIKLVLIQNANAHKFNKFMVSVCLLNSLYNYTSKWWSLWSVQFWSIVTHYHNLWATRCTQLCQWWASIYCMQLLYD